MSVVLTVYLFPAGEDQTTYRGALMATFMASQHGGGETKVDFTMKPGERPYYVASIDEATTIPGNYEFRIALLADVQGHVDPHQLDDVIPVRVVTQPT